MGWVTAWMNARLNNAFRTLSEQAKRDVIERASASTDQGLRFSFVPSGPYAFVVERSDSRRFFDEQFVRFDLRNDRIEITDKPGGDPVVVTVEPGRKDDEPVFRIGAWRCSASEVSQHALSDLLLVL